MSLRTLAERIRASTTRRLDGWFNELSGVGASGGRQVMRFGVMEGEYLGLADLEALYNFDGVAARVVDAVPEHALRQGFTVSTGAAEQETALLKALDDLRALEGRVRERFELLQAWLGAFLAATPDAAKLAPALREAAVVMLTERKLDREVQSTPEALDVTGLVRQFLQLESRFGMPLDIEWALASQELYILQARPIVHSRAPAAAAASVAAVALASKGV